MNSAPSIDTLNYKEALTSSGIPDQHADAITKSTTNAINQSILNAKFVTKSDLDHLRSDLLKSNNEAIWKIIGAMMTVQTTAVAVFSFVQHINN